MNSYKYFIIATDIHKFAFGEWASTVTELWQAENKINYSSTILMMMGMVGIM
jgi:hypothetical protein